MSMVLEAQGRVVRAYTKSNTIEGSAPQDTGHRGIVTGFSGRSRKRLIDLMNRLNPAGVRTTLLTLTYRSMPSHFEARTHLKVFLQWLRDRFPNVAGVWRKELQERGSIHFHLVLFRLPYIEQKFLQKRWEECSRQKLGIVDVRLVTSHRELLNYVSKYVAKVGAEDASLDSAPYQQNPSGAPGTGRWWGYLNKDMLPFANREYIEIDNPSDILWLKWWMHALSGRSCPPGFSGGTLYTDDAYEIVRHMYRTRGSRKKQSRREALHWHEVKHGLRTDKVRERGWSDGYITVGESVEPHRVIRFESAVRAAPMIFVNADFVPPNKPIEAFIEIL